MEDCIIQGFENYSISTSGVITNLNTNKVKKGWLLLCRSV